MGTDESVVVSRQARNLSWDLHAQVSQARFLICDNDKKFPFAFAHRPRR
jgi:hypothetical protein